MFVLYKDAASMFSGMPFHKKQTETKKECQNELIVEESNIKVSSSHSGIELNLEGTCEDGMNCH